MLDDIINNKVDLIVLLSGPVIGILIFLYLLWDNWRDEKNKKSEAE